MANPIDKTWGNHIAPVLLSGYPFIGLNNREYASGGALVFETSNSMTTTVPGEFYQPNAGVGILTYDEVTGDGSAYLFFNGGLAVEENLEAFYMGKLVTFDSGDSVTVTSAAFGYGGQVFSFTGRFPAPALVTDIEDMDPV